MSHPVTEPTVQSVAPDATVNTTADDAAAQAVVNHHTLLAAGLTQRAEKLMRSVADGHLPEAENARQDLLDYLGREILPHAGAEEHAMYPAAAAVPRGQLLVEGMIDEHHALIALVRELADADTLVRAASAGRALDALFAVHLHKENHLVLPLLIQTPGVSLAELLAGMHELLGADEPAADDTASAGCGCGECGCGGDRGPGSAGAERLSVDARLDVREIPHSQRHALVLSTVAALPAGEAVVLVASHAPRPVLAEIDGRFGAQIQTQWLQSGPEVWQIRLERLAVPAGSDR